MRSIRLHLQGDTERGNDWFINFPKEEIFLLWVWILNDSNLLFSLSFFSYHKAKNRFKVFFISLFFLNWLLLWLNAEWFILMIGMTMIFWISDLWFKKKQYKNQKRNGKSRTPPCFLIRSSVFLIFSSMLWSFMYIVFILICILRLLVTLLTIIALCTVVV